MINRYFSGVVCFFGLCLAVGASLLRVEAVEVELSGNDLPELQELLQAYIEANGGLANIQGMTSLVANGEIQDANGQMYPFKLYRKRPDKMRFQLTLPNGVERVTAFDGEIGFSMISRSGMPDEVSEMGESEALALKETSSLDGPFFLLRGRPEWLDLVAEVTVEEEPAYEIKIKDAANSFYDRIWIGQEHFQEVKLSRSLLEETKGLILEEIYFSDFVKIRGMWVAKTIRYEHDGEFVQMIHIDRLRANAGIFDSYFMKPQD
jgi:hypothetical protein